MIHNVKRFFSRVHNVLRWLPTIWNDRDYDDSYIVEILVKKLEHHRDFFLSDKPYSVNAHETAAEIQKAINGLRKTAESWEYETSVMEELDQKWGSGEFRFEPILDRPGLTELHIDYPNVKTPEDEAQHSKEYRKAMLAARKQYMKDKRAAYQYIADNIDKWWD